MSNLFRVEYIRDGVHKSTAAFSESTARIVASSFKSCYLYKNVEVVECVAQQPSPLPDIADRCDVRADGDGGCA